MTEIERLPDDILATLATYGFDRERFESLRDRIASGTLNAESNIVDGELVAPESDAWDEQPKKGSDELEEAREAGAKAIAAGHVGALILNGGMATRFGADCYLFVAPAFVDSAETRTRLIEKCGLDVHLRRGDLLDDTRPPRGGFHAVAANLPYIPSADLAGLQPEVRDFEPMSALDGGRDGLDLIRRLLDRCAQAGVLAAGGRVYLEIGIHQAPAVIDELRRRGFVDVAARRDYGGVERVIAATAPPRA